MSDSTDSGEDGDFPSLEDEQYPWRLSPLLGSLLKFTEIKGSSIMKTGKLLEVTKKKFEKKWKVYDARRASPTLIRSKDFIDDLSRLIRAMLHHTQMLVLFGKKNRRAASSILRSANSWLSRVRQCAAVRGAVPVYAQHIATVLSAQVHAITLAVNCKDVSLSLMLRSAPPGACRLTVLFALCALQSCGESSNSISLASEVLSIIGDENAGPKDPETIQILQAGWAFAVAARRLLRHGRSATAAKLLSKLEVIYVGYEIEPSPTVHAALVAMTAHIFLEAEKIQKCLDLCEKVLRKPFRPSDNTRREVVMTKVQACIHSGQWKRGRKTLMHGLLDGRAPSSPSTASAWVVRAGLDIVLGNEDDTLEAYRNAEKCWLIVSSNDENHPGVVSVRERMATITEKRKTEFKGKLFDVEEDEPQEEADGDVNGDSDYVDSDFESDESSGESHVVDLESDEAVPATTTTTTATATTTTTPHLYCAPVDGMTENLDDENTSEKDDELIDEIECGIIDVDGSLRVFLCPVSDGSIDIRTRYTKEIGIRAGLWSNGDIIKVFLRENYSPLSIHFIGTALSCNPDNEISVYLWERDYDELLPAIRNFQQKRREDSYRISRETQPKLKVDLVGRNDMIQAYLRVKGEPDESSGGIHPVIVRLRTDGDVLKSIVVPNPHLVDRHADKRTTVGRILCPVGGGETRSVLYDFERGVIVDEPDVFSM